jgi:hypothetical protein
VDDRQLRSLVSQAFSAAFNTVSLRCRFEYVRGDNGLAIDARVKFEENDGPRGRETWNMWEMWRLAPGSHQLTFTILTRAL